MGAEPRRVRFFFFEKFTEVPGQLAQIAVGAGNNVWGVNSAGLIFRFNGQVFEEVPGKLAQIAVGFGGGVWGLDASLDPTINFDSGFLTTERPLGGFLTIHLNNTNGEG